MTRTLLCLLMLTCIPLILSAQTKTPGTIQGRIMESPANIPVEYANVALVDTLTGKIVTGTVTDSTGIFRLTNVPHGIFFVDYSFIGYEKKRSKAVGIDRKNTKIDLGVLTLSPSAVNMKEVNVTAEKNMIVNRIDRKIFNVQQDITAQTGTVTDVLQNIPAVSVDMDGNISLRGSGNVMILVNGRPSSMTGAATLEQMPANMIERIEVITNPSAKYRPDGTAGIINIVLKKNRKAGFNGTLGGNIGNNDRYTANMQLNMNTGKVNIFGSYGFRKDYRWRRSDLNSQTIDSLSGKSTWLTQWSEGYARPVSHMAQLGLDWSISDNDVAGISGILNYRDLNRVSTANYIYRDDSLHPTEEFNRYQEGPDYEMSLGANAYYEHTFDRDTDHKLRLDFVFESDNEHENYTYNTVYNLPLYPYVMDFNYNHITNKNFNLAGTYSRPLWKDASLETGYDGNIDIDEQNFLVQHWDQEKSSWITDSSLTNHFKGNLTVHAVFATLSYSVKKFSFMAGLRPELALLKLDFISTNSSVGQTYFALYPTLHLSLASGKNEWQLNYSRRVNRPDPEDLNPVPEYRDPRNYFVGNPDLKPEEIHSVEFGYAVKTEHVNLIPAVFYRYRVNGFTTVTYMKNDTVQVTTMDNLANDQSAGIDFSGNAQAGKWLNLNFSLSGFYNEIDASNLGYSSSKSVLSWNAKVNASFNITKSTILQVNAQYRSAQLTPQGMRYPTWVVNMGFRQDFLKKKLSLVVTASDIFNSNAVKTTVDTPYLIQDNLRRRDAPVLYAGLVFNFSTNSKKAKEEKFEFDNGMEK